MFTAYLAKKWTFATPGPIGEGVRRGGALVVVESSDEGGGAWHGDSPDACTQSISTRVPPNGGTRAGPGLTPLPAPSKPTVEPGDRDAQYPGAGALHATGGRPGSAHIHGQDEVAIPVVHEDITIGTREVERGHVRIDRRVTEQPVEEAVRLREEKVTVERRPVDRPATDADLAAAATKVN